MADKKNDEEPDKYNYDARERKDYAADHDEAVEALDAEIEEAMKKAPKGA